jgi:large subunit ribosomal protein L25
MSRMVEMKATARPRSGKGAARQARAKGRVPGVIYGNKEPPLTLLVDYNELWKAVHKGGFLSTIFEIDVEGQKSRVIPRDVQFDPVMDFPIHVDFQRVSSDGRVRVAVPVRFTDEASSPGLKRGGVLNVVRHEVEVLAPADRIPDFFEASLAGLEIGRSIHISAFNLPSDIETVIRGRDFTVATIAGSVPSDAAASEAASDAKPAAAAGGKAPAAAAKAPAAAAKAPAAGGGAKKK